MYFQKSNLTKKSRKKFHFPTRGQLQWNFDETDSRLSNSNTSFFEDFESFPDLPNDRILNEKNSCWPVKKTFKISNAETFDAPEKMTSSHAEIDESYDLMMTSDFEFAIN